MSADTFKARSALLGLSPRAARILGYRAVYEGTQYADRLPWKPDVDERGKVIPAHLRAPCVQLDLARTAVDRLIAKLVGEGRLPTVTVRSGRAVETEADDGTTEVSDETGDKVASILWDDGLDLTQAVFTPILDLVLAGSCVLGFARPEKNRWEFLPLETEWCEPIFVGAVKSPRARQLAAEMAEIQGVTVPKDADGPYLAAPKGARSTDVAFLRYQIQFDEESAERHGGPATKSATYLLRRDYTPDAIVEYEPVQVFAERLNAAPDFIAKPVKPHRWGVVPIVWVKSLGARPNDVDGPSFLKPALLRLAESADIAASRADDNVATTANPLISRLDVMSPVQAINTERGYHEAAGELYTGPDAVLDHRSVGQKQGKVELLETTGTGVKVGADHVAMLSKHAARVSGIVEFESSENVGALSGVAMERLIEPTIASVNGYRGVLSPAIRLLVTKLAAAMAADKAIATPEVTTAVTWPKVVPLTAADVAAWSQALVAASGGPVISQETAVRLFAQAVELDDPEEEVARVADDAMRAAEQAEIIAGAKKDAAEDADPDAEEGDPDQPPAA